MWRREKRSVRPCRSDTTTLRAIRYRAVLRGWAFHPTLRDRLKGSNIWVAGSRDYRAFEDYLLPAEASQNVGIGDETDPDRYVAGRATALHERLGFVAVGLRAANSTALRSRMANSTSPGASRPSRTLHGTLPFG